jgi:nucleoside-diphosphate-sugar epimerase
MKVLVAGATGALGRQLVAQLVARGHEMFGMTRSDSKRDEVRKLGAVPVVADALDRFATSSSTTSPPRSRSGCQRWRPHWARDRPGGCHA